MSGYPGSKGAEGVVQQLINLMPPHRLYCEPFLGTGFVLRAKRPALVNVGLDLDPASPFLAGQPGCQSAVGSWQAAGSPIVARSADRVVELASTVRAMVDPIARSRDPIAINGEPAGSPQAARVDRLPPELASAAADCRLVLAICDGIEFLRCYPWRGDELIYCDPPYVPSSRKDPRPIYRCEMSLRDHGRLLDVLRGIPARVILSGYPSDLYARRLRKWDSISYRAMTRRGPVTEWAWFNFARPVALHDYRFLGRNFREREKINKRIRRLKGKLSKQSLLERQALLAAVTEYFAPGAIAGNGE